MEKELLEKLINEGLSTREIGEKVNKAQTTVRHWLIKYGLKTNNAQFNKNLISRHQQSHRICPCCKQELEITNFYKKAGILFDSTYCKKCTNNQTVIRMVNHKMKCVEYKGGKCIECGYNKYYGALEFHHLDPKLKDFTISHLRAYTFNKIVTDELDKCVLLCNRCHREVEGGIIVLTEAQKGM
jgi:hypothetical protein